MTKKPMSVLEESHEIEVYFKNHVATREIYKSGNKTVEVVKWAKPDTGIGRVVYIRMRNALFVTGDHYEATYGWGGEEMTLDWVGGLNLDYFAGKCMASPSGRGYRCWDSYRAEFSIREHLKEYGSEYKYEDLENDYIALSSQFEWLDWLNNYGDKYFDDYRYMGEIGMTIDYQCHMHLIGLKMATQQLNKGEKHGE